jgi:cytochrome c-type biogenesis protein CcmH/NrfF
MDDALAAHFQAGAILTWALPVAVVVGIGIYWALVLRRRRFSDES